MKKANKDILEHDRKRQIQLKFLLLQDNHADQGYTDNEISLKLDEARCTFQAVDAPLVFDYNKYVYYATSLYYYYLHDSSFHGIIISNPQLLNSDM
ncbi:hypothetical protein GIB67_023897 [Kingdonia uniflora]|uniref:CWF21 domain-containing protein n=1 Tax=Kingdonia uniflora TaxID=39325 RepID=A0A7J7NG98_9MAGN|nr:hypothetical protein GIB67_023897 [Kingdonia uniflora]